MTNLPPKDLAEANKALRAAYMAYCTLQGIDLQYSHVIATPLDAIWAAFLELAKKNLSSTTYRALGRNKA